MRKPEMGRAGHENFRRHVAALIARSGKSQKEIALSLGYCNANIITMFNRMTAGSYRLARATAFEVWKEETCARRMA